jgi:ABC-2 type transport system permease protein
MMNRFAWAVRRELWESRWLYLAPFAVAVALAVGFAVGFPFHVAGPMTDKTVADLYDLVAGLMMVTGFLVGAIYCVDALYSERHDRSVLFWKSLPVSDVLTIVTKLFIPMVLLPVLTWLLTVGVQLVMLLSIGITLAAKGLNPSVVWSSIRPLSTAFPLLYHLVGLHGLYAAPLYGWLILVSAWAPRAPFAWAVLPPLALVFLERVTLGTMHFAGVILSRLGAEPGQAPARTGGSMLDNMNWLPMSDFIVAPRLWLGLAVAALFVYAAVRLRRLALPT